MLRFRPAVELIFYLAHYLLRLHEPPAQRLVVQRDIRERQSAFNDIGNIVDII
jgi:hypothetical protein